MNFEISKERRKNQVKYLDGDVRNIQGTKIIRLLYCKSIKDSCEFLEKEDDRTKQDHLSAGAY